MGKRKANNSKRIKTSHKKSLIKRKIVNKKVNDGIKNINSFVSNAIVTEPKKEAPSVDPEAPQIEVEVMNMADFQKLLGGESKKKEKIGKFSIDDGIYLEKLIKKWGDNYGRMAQDAKRNRMQWTAHQIEKKHEAYKKLFPENNA